MPRETNTSSSTIEITVRGDGIRIVASVARSPWDRDGKPGDELPGFNKAAVAAAPKFVPVTKDGIENADLVHSPAAPAVAGCSWRLRDRQAPAPAARVERLIEACHLQPEAILDYLAAEGHGTFPAIADVPPELLALVADWWPDILIDVAFGVLTRAGK